MPQCSDAEIKVFCDVQRKFIEINELLVDKLCEKLDEIESLKRKLLKK